MFDDVIPGLPGVKLERGVPCRMRDGVTLYADVYRPAEGGPHPVILMRTPYNRGSAESDFAYTHPSWYARHGYVVAVQDCRGCYASEGEWYPFRDEAADGYDTVEWAARLPGTTGKVGMYGMSYPGATQLLAASASPPSLTTICPAFTGSQYYEGWTYNQGALALAFVPWWATLLAAGAVGRRGDEETFARLVAGLLEAGPLAWTLPLRDYAPLRGGEAPYWRDWLKHSTYDDYWRRWSIDEDYTRVRVPALHFGGWYDIFLSGTVKNFLGCRREAGGEAARRAQKLVIGPWVHTPWAPVAGQGAADAGGRAVDDWQLRWFDQMLKGRETGVLDAPVTLFLLDGGWRDFDAWPPAGSRPVDWFLHSGGRANSAFGDGTLSTEPPGDEPPDLYVYDPLAPTPSCGGHSCGPPGPTPLGPADQAPAERLNSVLVYTSAPLPRDLELVGDVSVTLHAASSALDTDFVARLCVVDETGCSTNLQEGILRARFRDSLGEPKPLVPGRVYELHIPLGPVGARVPAGRRLRVDVASSDFPQWDRNLNTGGRLGEEGPLAAIQATQVVLHDRAHPSRITLPVLA